MGCIFLKAGLSAFASLTWHCWVHLPVRCGLALCSSTREVAKATNLAAPSGEHRSPAPCSLVGPAACHPDQSCPCSSNWVVPGTCVPFKLQSPRVSAGQPWEGQSGWVPQGWDWGGTHKGTLCREKGKGLDGQPQGKLEPPGRGTWVLTRLPEEAAAAPRSVQRNPEGSRHLHSG